MNTLHLNGNQGNSTLSTSRNSSSNYKAIKAPGQQEANNSTSALKPFAETTNTRKAVKPHFEGD